MRVAAVAGCAFALGRCAYGVAAVGANEYFFATMANACTNVGAHIEAAYDPGAARRRRRLCRLLLALIGGLLAVGTAHAQPGNLVPGPDFDSASDLTNHWQNLGVAKTWSSLDFEDDPFSGSVSIDNMEPSPAVGIAIFTPCFPVVERNSYEFSAWQYTPSPPQGEGAARLLLQWRESCPQGPFLGGDAIASSDALGAWTYFSGEAEAPVGAGGARLWLLSVKITVDGGYNVYFDHVFVPEPSGALATCAAATALAILRRRRA